MTKSPVSIFIQVTLCLLPLTAFTKTVTDTDTNQDFHAIHQD